MITSKNLLTLKSTTNPFTPATEKNNSLLENLAGQESCKSFPSSSFACLVYVGSEIGNFCVNGSFRSVPVSFASDFLVFSFSVSHMFFFALCPDIFFVTKQSEV